MLQTLCEPGSHRGCFLTAGKRCSLLYEKFLEGYFKGTKLWSFTFVNLPLKWRSASVQKLWNVKVNRVNVTSHVHVDTQERWGQTHRVCSTWPWLRLCLIQSGEVLRAAPQATLHTLSTPAPPPTHDPRLSVWQPPIRTSPVTTPDPH